MSIQPLPQETRRPAPESTGFALPVVLLTLAIVSLLAATGLLLTWLEGRAAQAFALGTRAFYVAEAGLATALATATGPTPTLTPLVLTTGTARVSFEKLLDLGAGEALYRIESEGSTPSNGMTILRRVGQLAWIPAPPRAAGALTTTAPVLGGAPAGRISGFDVGGCGGTPSVAGVAYWGTSPLPPGSTVAVSGLPPARAISSSISVAAETGLRWAELLASFGPTPDATVPPDPWPGPSVGGGWPFILVHGPISLSAARSGRGALVVDGDLLLGPGFSWDGLLLVGGTLRLGGSLRVRGAVMAGLAGTMPQAADFGSYAVDIEYDTCAVGRAAARLAAPAARIPGTWYEAW